MFEVPGEIIRSLLDGESASDWRDILDRISPDHPAGLEDVAALIKAAQTDNDARTAILNRAGDIKRLVFGNQVKLFVPVYISNVCVNECLYCAYRSPNKEMPRRTLAVDELRDEIREVARMGYRVIELVTSESPELRDKNLLPEYVRATREILDETGQGIYPGEIILMSWALSEDELRDVHDAGLDAFYIWQETYDSDAYSRLHPVSSPKSDFAWRVGIFDRAIKSGIGKVGMGVLFGLADWRFDLLALVSHGDYLRKEYGITPDAIGIPRFRHAEGSAMTEAPCPVSDDDLKLAVALYRLAFPHSHVFLNTREKLSLLVELLKGGGSEMNIACAVYPGGYTDPRRDRQFDYYSYPTDKTVQRLMENGCEVTHFAKPVLVEE
jgi:2-iminoacetate synthase